MKWNSTDPREYCVNNFIEVLDIIIVDLALNEIYKGEVWVQYSYFVYVYDEIKVTADDEWPGSWIWTKYPNRRDLK